MEEKKAQHSEKSKMSTSRRMSAPGGRESQREQAPPSHSQSNHSRGAAASATALPKPPPHSRSNNRAVPRGASSGRIAAGASSSRSTARPCKEHSFLTDVADVRQMEQGLISLLHDFHSGKLQAFGKDCSFEKMDNVREMQEKLARLHFDLDAAQENYGLDSEEAKASANKHLDQLLGNLDQLSQSIQSLHPKETPPTNRQDTTPG
ncbi:uncharacterized protein LOC144926998 [Branchiostoma floridae x Branchiostoma belcheri]